MTPPKKLRTPLNAKPIAVMPSSTPRRLVFDFSVFLSQPSHDTTASSVAPRAARIVASTTCEKCSTCAVAAAVVLATDAIAWSAAANDARSTSSPSAAKRSATFNGCPSSAVCWRGCTRRARGKPRARR